jgi:hypothetical protein
MTDKRHSRADTLALTDAIIEEILRVICNSFSFSTTNGGSGQYTGIPVFC